MQGVFFRKHVVDTAEQYQLTGWVRNNNHDGSVEGEAQGEEAILQETFLGSLKRGSEHSRVDKVDVEHLDVIADDVRFEKIKNAR